MKSYVYILECNDKTYYIGYTTNLEKRLKLHNEKKASKYTRGRTPVKYVYIKEFNSKSEAMRAEVYLKQLNRTEKNMLIDDKIVYENILNKKLGDKTINE